MKQDKGKHSYVSYKNYIVNFEASRCQIILTHKFYPKILSSFVVEEKIMINYWWNFFFFFDELVFQVTEMIVCVEIVVTMTKYSLPLVLTYCK